MTSKKEKYKGSLTLEWYNKEKSIIFQTEKNKSKKDIPIVQLNWVNKDESLFYEIDEKDGKGLKPYWVDRNDIRVKEPRQLILQKTFVAIEKTKEGELSGIGNKEYKIKDGIVDNDNIENMLIKGDNLLALNTLVKMFGNKPDEEKIKLIYIDPPYNIDVALKYFDDNLEHSEWLSMMRDRLILLRNLLREDGLFFIQIDEKNMAYLKILCDELFGRNNFLSQITVKTKSSAGVGQESFLFDIIEYILVYSKSPGRGKNYTPYIFNEIDNKTFKNYYHIIESFGTEKLVKEISGGHTSNIKVYSHNDYSIKTIPVSKRNNEKYFDNYKKIFRTTNPQGGLMKRVIPQLPSGELISIEYIPSKGKNANKLYRYYFYKGSLIIWLKDTARVIGNKVEKSVRNHNLWTENLWQGIAKEGSIEFPKSKKPEKLLKRIIEMSSNKGDIILDSFSGSGTTISVAHKLERNWIGIEIGNHADTHIIKRMKEILSGKDQTGISKEVNWNGGGSFKYYQLGPSILKIDKNGNRDFNWDLDTRHIAESILYYFDYQKLNNKSIPDDYIIGYQAEVSNGIIGIVKIINPEIENRFIITEMEISHILEIIQKEYNPSKSYLFTNCGVNFSNDSLPEILGVIKVPQEILSSLE